MPIFDESSQLETLFQGPIEFNFSRTYSVHVLYLYLIEKAVERKRLTNHGSKNTVDNLHNEVSEQIGCIKV